MGFWSNLTNCRPPRTLFEITGVNLKRILLIDADMAVYRKRKGRKRRAIMPNLALAQISSYHKEQGDEVSLNNPNNPHTVYISCVFKQNRNSAIGRSRYYPNAEIHLGGSGINYSWLPLEFRKQYPDYSLYDQKVCQKCAHLIYNCKCKRGPTPGDMFYSMGFTTRGCTRNCPYCIVRAKEGELQRW